MRITIFGASGRVGQQVVSRALAEGHEITVFVHKHNPFDDARITAVLGDVADPVAVAKAVEGSNAVISTLGSWGTKNKNTLETAMTVLIPAMQAQKIGRIITLTGAGAYCDSDNWLLLDKLNHWFLGLVAPRILHDSEAHLRLLRASKLYWTCIRSPVMTSNSSDKYQLRLTSAKPWATIPRAAVAQAMIDQLDNQSFVGQAPIIHRK